MIKAVIPSPYIDRSDYLRELSEKTTVEYIRDKKVPNTKFIKEHFLQDSPCFDLLNIGSGLWNIIENAYLDGIGEIITDIELPIQEIVKDYVHTGKIVLSLAQDESNTEYKHIPWHAFAVIDWIPTIFFDLEKEDEQGNITKYRFVKKHYIGTNTNQLFVLDGSETEVSLKSIEETEEYQDEETTGMDEYSIVWHEDQGVFPVIHSLIEAIERKIVSVDTEIIKYIKQKTIISGTAKMDADAWKDDVVALEDSGASVDILKYTNNLLLEAWEIIEKQIQLISGITKVTLDQFGIESSTSIGAEAQKTRKSGYVNRMKTIRGLIETLTKKFDDTLNFRWSEVLAQDKMEQVEELKLAQDSGYITPIMAIMMYNNIPEDEALALYTEIWTYQTSSQQNQ